MEDVHITNVDEVSNIILAGLKDQCKQFDGLLTETSLSQTNCEETCAFYLIPEDRLQEREKQQRYKNKFYNCEGKTELNADMHCSYLRGHFGQLPHKYMGQVSSYSLYLLGLSITL